MYKKKPTNRRTWRGVKFLTTWRARTIHQRVEERCRRRAAAAAAVPNANPRVEKVVNYNEIKKIKKLYAYKEKKKSKEEIAGLIPGERVVVVTAVAAAEGVL